MEGRTCVFCDAPSSKSGEHVLSMWLIRMFHGQGPFHMEVNGEPQFTKRGSLRTSSALQGARVPCCEGHNRVLNGRFEAAKDIVRPAAERPADSRWSGLSEHDVTTLAEWVLKVGLLSKHPAATFDDPVMNERSERWNDADPVLYDWMVSGDPAPRWLSLFASFQSNDVPQRADLLIHVPKLTVVDDTSHVARCTHLGVLDLTFDVLYHPLRSVVHPLAPQGAFEVVGGSATGAGLNALVPRNPRDLRFLVSGSIAVRTGVDPADLPPIGEAEPDDLFEMGLVTMVST